MNEPTAAGIDSLAFPINGGDGRPVVERLGLIVRALHDTLREIGADDVLTDAASEFPFARQRLLHIAELTENAANIVLAKVEENGPPLAALMAKASTLDLSWAQSAAAGAPQHAQLVETTRTFLAEMQTGCGSARTAFSDMMMAQDFQDLTGQLIKKVVDLMARMENDLLKLLIDGAPPGAAVHVPRADVTAGPGAPGSVALAQENVDDLLADLGF